MHTFELHRLPSRTLRTFAPIALSTALVVSGCETQHADSAPRVEVRAADGPSTEIITHADEIAKSIVQSDAFAELVEVSVTLAGELQAAQRKLSDEEVDAIARTVAEPSFAEVMSGEALVEELGSRPEHLKDIRNLVGEIREAQGLIDVSAADIRHVFERVVETEEAQDLIERSMEEDLAERLLAEGLEPDTAACEAACYNALFVESMLPIGLFLVEMAVAAFFFPYGLLIVPWAIGQLNRGMAQVRAHLEECLDDCDGDSGDGTVCVNFQLCKPDEYCWRGILGIGGGECRPQKGQGEVCSGHEACESSCCKRHVWSHPVSKVCRPTNACN